MRRVGVCSFYTCFRRRINLSEMLVCVGRCGMLVYSESCYTSIYSCGQRSAHYRGTVVAVGGAEHGSATAAAADIAAAESATAQASKIGGAASVTASAAEGGAATDGAGSATAVAAEVASASSEAWLCGCFFWYFSFYT